jgi:hypothetical protein
LKRVLTGLLRVVIGVLLGLVLAELAFWWRDDGAFPHVNLYEPDAELGARLVRNGSQRLAFTGNPATTVRTNSRGFRGGEWPAPTENELIVVGDSQVFGLGVEDDQTVPARLGAVSKRQVINAGVPTYGPAEYLATARRLVKERPKAGVVLVFNVANDFFELERPNTSRHAVWDGWAVRKENRPSEVTEFPGRSWLFGKSHLVFALRKLEIEQQELKGESEVLIGFESGRRDPGTPSEGSWDDLLTTSERQQALQQRRAQEKPGPVADATVPLQQAAAKELAELDRLEELDTGTSDFRLRNPRFVDEVLSKQVGDVVRDTGSEMARSIPVTAALLEKAAEQKRKLAELRAKNERARVPHLDLLKKTLAELEVLRWDVPPPVPDDPVLGEGLLDELAALAKEREVALVVLPLDVQVSPEEWNKYKARQRDMRSTLSLNLAFAAAARKKGIRTVDPTDALRAAEPGAFLDGDLHLTTKGVEAVAKAVADGLAAPAPLVASMPPGVTRLPSPAEWGAVKEVTVKGSTAAQCETKQVREWLRVRCFFREGDEAYRGVRLIRGRRAEVQLAATPPFASVVLPVREGGDVAVGFLSDDELEGAQFERVLNVTWPANVPTPSFELRPRVRAPNERWLDTAEPRVIECERKLGGPDSAPWGNAEPGSECLDYADCVRLLACMQGHPHARPKCPAGSVNAGPDGRCLVSCETDHDCAKATRGATSSCLPWGERRACF